MRKRKTLVLITLLAAMVCGANRIQAQTRQPGNIGSRAEEKPYIHTDKPYYYPGEKIWFKAYMNYRTNDLVDSLSKVLYVELISPDKKIVKTQRIFIDGGSGSGTMPLPESIPGGRYYLRAYTQWMLNFDRHLIFLKALPVLNWNEIPEVVRPSDSETTPGLTFNTDRASFRPRQRIRLGIELRDKSGKPLAADLSISITDMNQVIPVPESQNILRWFPFASESSRTGAVQFPVEQGISVQGQLVQKDGKPVKTNFVAVEGNFKSTKPVVLDEAGNFFVSGFLFYDSASIGFQMEGKKKKESVEVRIKERTIPEIIDTPAVLPFTIKETAIASKKRQTVANPEEAILLKEVVVKEEREKLNKDAVPNTYAKADFSISSEDIIRSSRTSLMDALRGRVPGLTVVDGYLRFGNPSNFMGPASSEPLLIVDGVQITKGPGDSNYNRLMQINPEIVERVDVIKYGGGAIYGSRGSNGVIIVTTKSGEYNVGAANSSKSGFLKVITVRGFSRPDVFFSPDYSKATGEKWFDDRATIYWNADLTTDAISGRANVIFYAADSPARYRVVVEGVTASGEPVRSEYYISIH